MNIKNLPPRRNKKITWRENVELILISLLLAFYTVSSYQADKQSKQGYLPESHEVEAAEDKSHIKNIVMVTDVGGVDDKSFNQGAWEGIKQIGTEIGLSKDPSGYTYLHSQTEADYVTNLSLAVQNNYDLTVAVGYKFQEPMTQIAKQNPDSNFVIVDSTVEQPNVASLNFRDEEAAYLAGVAAARTTKTGHIGFIGGVEGVVIDKFEAGFVQGVIDTNPELHVHIQYANSFVDAPKGRQLAQAMYANGIDIIFHAAGPTGNGVFAEAKDLKRLDLKRDIWVIGVDLDQSAEGEFEVHGNEYNVNLTSTLKNTGNALYSFISEANANGFKPGVFWNDLSNRGVGLAEGRLNPELIKELERVKQLIIAGQIHVPEKPEQIKTIE